MVQAAWRYRWSSAAAHCSLGPVPGWLDLSSWREAWGAEAWREQLRVREDEEIIEHLRLSTHTGRPLGSDTFLSKVEHVLGRRLRPLPVGRPRKRPGGQK
jgi:putative transposase